MKREAWCVVRGAWSVVCGLWSAALLLSLLTVPLSGGAVLAQDPTPTEKPPPPPTPTPEPPTATPPPPSPTPQPTVPPTATEKPPAPPTPTPPLPTATPPPPTATSVPPVETPGPGVSTPGAPPDPTATATPGGPTATRGAALPSPTATPGGEGAVERPTATLVLSPALSEVEGEAEGLSGVGHDESESEETGLSARLRSLPRWAPWVGGLALLAALAFGAWLVTRFVSYTARDIRLKERMLARDAQANITDLNTAIRQLGQLAFDATGIAPGIDQVTRVIGAPVPAILTLGRDYLLYVFTPAPPRTFREHQQALVGDGTVRDRFRIDARTSGPTVVYELARVWEIVAEASDVPLPQRALPRARQWWLYVVKPG